MDTSEFYRGMTVDHSPLSAAGFNPYYRPLDGLQNGQPWIGRQPYFDLASNDYLGLASDARLQEAMSSAIQEFGSSMCGTPIACGYATVLRVLERELADFLGLEQAVIFPSCYQANVALFPALATTRDLILVDHYAHASLAHGIKAAGCKIKPFLHNDTAHLERQLATSHGFRQTFVVTEGVFSTEGSVASLDTIVDLCRRYEAVPVVDDSHGLGVLGMNGRGILEQKGVTNFPGIYTASLGKALANLGGVVAGKKCLIEALKYSCPGLIYSTALPPANAAGALCALRIIQGEFSQLRTVCERNHRLLVSTLVERGFTVQCGEAPIATVRGGTAENTIALARDFFKHRLLTTPFVPPSVPEGKGVLRLIVGAKLNPVGMRELVEALETMEVPSAQAAQQLVTCAQ